MNKQDFIPSFLAELREKKELFHKSPSKFNALPKNVQHLLSPILALDKKCKNPVDISVDDLTTLFDLLLAHIFKELMKPHVSSVSLGHSFGTLQKTVLPRLDTINPITGKKQTRFPQYTVRFSPSDSLKKRFKSLPTPTKK